MTEIESGGADFREPDRRQVYFAGEFGEATRCDFVNLEAGKALHLAVALLRSVIDIVVAEGAKVERGQWAGPLATDHARICVEPGRTIAPRQSRADVQPAVELGIKMPIRPAIPFSGATPPCALVVLV